VSPDLDAIRTDLERDLQALQHELSSLTEVSRDPAAPIGFGKRVGEGTTEAIGRIERAGQADMLAAKLGDVRRALEKLDEATYGTCDRCGASIQHERLEARPSSVLCVRCRMES
jgi:DnaK suppressor protein